MNFFETIKGWFKPRKKQWPTWTPLGGGSHQSTDFYGRQPPTNDQLIGAFNDTIWSCCTLIAYHCSIVPIRLYVKTEAGQPRPKCLTREVSRKGLEVIGKRLGRATKVEEVVSHPSLDLLNVGSNFHNWLELVEYTQLYLDVCGNAFWLVRKFEEVPYEIYLLPTQSIRPKRDEKTGYIIGWIQTTVSGEEEYTLDEVIHFKGPNLADPYGLGMSPTMAAWNRLQIGFKELGYLDATLSNMGRPDFALSPDEPIAPVEAQRLATDFMQRYRDQGNGGPWVADGPMKITPLNFPPRDLAEFQLYQAIKNAVSNTFAVPPDIWELGQSNRSSSEAVLYALAMHSIKPRLCRIVEKLNEKFITQFDDSGRLFFEADSPVPEDKEFLLRERQMLLTTGCILRDEGRQLYGFDSAEWAKEPILPPGALPPDAVPNDQDAPPSDPQPEKDRTALAPALAAMQAQVQAGQIDRLAAIANAMLTMGFTSEEAQALFPDVPPKAEPREEVGTKALDVPDLRQTEPYDCGAVATQIVCQFFGLPTTTEADMISALGTTEEDGTPPENIIGYLQSVGLKVEARNDLTIQDLMDCTSRGSPVIVPIQDYEDDEAEIVDEEAGHYVVVTGVDRDGDSYAVSVADPWGGKVTLDAVDFLARWEDRTSQEQFIHFGIAVSKGQKSHKRFRTKTIKRKSPQLMAEALIGFFRKQKAAVEKRIKSLDDFETKALGDDWFDLEHWSKEMAEVMRPIVALYAEDSAKKTVGRIGASWNLLNVTQPKLKEGVDRATMLFCKETQETTSQEIGLAIKDLRQSLTEGLQAGEYNNQLMKRVGEIFDNAEVYRSWRIAVTEANRAQHAAQFLVAKESGIVKGKRWILSSEACDKCKPMAGKIVGLDDNFTTLEGNAAYSDIPYPPLHPGCRCDAIEVIEGIND